MDAEPTEIIPWILEFSIEKIKKIKFSSFMRTPWPITNLTEVLLLLDNLTHLYIERTLIRDSQWFGRRYPKLTHLYLDEAGAIQSDHWVLFFRNNPQLQHVRMYQTFARGYIDGSAAEIIDMSNVRTLEISETRIECDLGTVRTGNLSILELTYTEPRFAKIISLEQLLNENKGLETLCMKVCQEYSIDKFCFRISDDDIQFICSYQKIKNLEITYAKLTTYQVEMIMCSLPLLASLKFLSRFELNEIIENTKAILLEAAKHPNLNSITFLMHNKSYTRTKEWDFYAWLIQNVKNVVHFVSEQSITTVENGIINANGFLITRSEVDSNELKLNFQELNKYFKVENPIDLLKLYDTDERIRSNIEKTIDSYFQKNFLDIDYSGGKFIFESFLQNYGRFMTRVWVRRNTEEVESILNSISNHCGSNLKEIYLTEDTRSFGILMKPLLFPEVTKMVIENFERCDIHWLSYLQCPKLRHLEIKQSDECEEQDDQTKEMMNQLNYFSNLQTLKFDKFHSCLIELLELMEQKNCDNLHELTIIGLETDRLDYQLVNAIAKFRNLDKLALIIDGIDFINTKYLFENCSKLKRLELFHAISSSQDHVNQLTRVLNDIKRICVQLESIQIIEPGRVEQVLNHQQIKELFPDGVINIRLNS